MLALQHQLRQQFATVDSIISELSKIRVDSRSIQAKIDELRTSLSEWLQRARATNDLFSFMADPRNIQNRKRYRASVLIDDIAHQLRSLARGIPIVSRRVDPTLLLPLGSMAEWSAIFQNVFTNSFNALVDSETKLVDVSSRSRQLNREILIQNTGEPVNLDEAERFFEPFVRKITISPERRMLGYGGTGLGLTIVRMIAHNLGCNVEFVIPEKGFNTAFALKWRESK
jgi:signal transduction histidine kinase